MQITAVFVLGVSCVAQQVVYQIWGRRVWRAGRAAAGCSAGLAPRTGRPNLMILTCATSLIRVKTPAAARLSSDNSARRPGSSGEPFVRLSSGCCLRLVAFVHNSNSYVCCLLLAVPDGLLCGQLQLRSSSDACNFMLFNFAPRALRTLIVIPWLENAGKTGRIH